MRQLILDIRPDAPPDFDNFLPGPNIEACAVLRDHAAGLIDEPVLHLWGEAGTGKSHLLAAWAKLAGAITSTPLPEPPVRWLALDDVQHLDADDQIRLFSLVNAAREGAGRILTSGPLPPSQLGLRPDLATRLAQGLVFRLSPLGDADKLAALHVRAEAHGLHLPEEVTRYLLTHCRRDLPRLLATVDALDTYSLSRKRPVSVPLLKEVLLQIQA
ncbi:MAG: DnaA regulatory inactivator Hda [Thiobacillaceae bacterium]|jgi:DnaA-homolog protein|nr:DnaA regulatory inactivator Hda [Hydrogenophilales bacterium]MBP8901097.1 DnaA regulatory inactivator Hda [Thiobacillaceae bacterium]MBP9916242.1 DnaA regulatory inactivator Hda [Thiobacillaceae bacterium]